MNAEETERFPSKSHIDYLIDSGKLEEVYQEMKCKTPSHDPRNKTCGSCSFHKIEIVKLKIDPAKKVSAVHIERYNPEIPDAVHTENYESDGVLESIFTTSSEIAEPHCLITDYISLKRV